MAVIERVRPLARGRVDRGRAVAGRGGRPGRRIIGIHVAGGEGRAGHQRAVLFHRARVVAGADHGRIAIARDRDRHRAGIAESVFVGDRDQEAVGERVPFAQTLHGGMAVIERVRPLARGRVDRGRAVAGRGGRPGRRVIGIHVAGGEGRAGQQRAVLCHRAVSLPAPITGASPSPVIVIVTVRVSLSPSSSVTVTRKLSVSVSPSPKPCTAAWLLSSVYVHWPVAESIAAEP